MWEKPNGDPLTANEQSLLDAMTVAVAAAVNAFDLVYFTLLMVN